MRSRHGAHLGWVVGLLLVAHVSAPRADGKPRSTATSETLPRPSAPTALPHFLAGNAWLKQARESVEPGVQRKAYEEAAKEFVKAAQTEQAAPYSLFWNLGYTHQKLGQLTKAEWYYRQFLEKAPERFVGHREAARGAIASLSAAASDADPPPPERTTVIREPIIQLISVPSGPAPVPPAPPRWYDDHLGWGLVGLGAAGVVAGGGLMWSGAGLHAEADGEPQASVARGLIDRGERRHELGAVVGGLGLAVVTAGVIRLVLQPETGRERATVAASWSPNGLIVGGTF